MILATDLWCPVSCSTTYSDSFLCLQKENRKNGEDDDMDDGRWKDTDADYEGHEEEHSEGKARGVCTDATDAITGDFD